MRLRTKLVLVALVSTLPFVVALPWALRAVQRAFDAELNSRLAGAERAAQASAADLSDKVGRALSKLAVDPAVEDLVRSLHDAKLDRGELAQSGTAARLMALMELDALEILDDQGRILASGHLPGRAGDLDGDGVELASRQPGRPVPRRIDIAAANGFAPALAMLAALPVDYGATRIYLVGGRTFGQAWAERLKELTGAAIAVLDGERELARTEAIELPRQAKIPVGELGSVVVELSDQAVRRTKSQIARVALGLWLAALGAALALAVILARRISRPVDALAQGARALAQGSLGHQVAVSSSGEIDELVRAFNAMSSDLRSATDRAVVAERVAAWQGVARRLAHEIKNPLTPIRMSVETLVAAHRAGRSDFDEIFRESAQAVLEEVERLRRIVDEFSQFARLPKPTLAPLELAELAGSVLALYSSPPEGIRIDRELGEGLQVEADRDQLWQVLINLLTNAIQAMPQGGRVLLRAVSLGEGSAALEVADQGPGIAAENRARLFEPYFTTKEGGTGLGLAIALRIAQEHGGTLEEIGLEGGGRGARFRLTLPRAR